MEDNETITDEEMVAEDTLESAAVVHEEYVPPEIVQPREVFTEPGKQAILDQKGGDPNSWVLESSGAGFIFDGENVRGPDGAVWQNADTALHQEMLMQWKEGGPQVFFLPEHKVEGETFEATYSTLLMLSEEREVTYAIYSHTIAIPRTESIQPEEKFRTSQEVSPRSFEDLYQVHAESTESTKPETIAASAELEEQIHVPESEDSDIESGESSDHRVLTQQLMDLLREDGVGSNPAFVPGAASVAANQDTKPDTKSSPGFSRNGITLRRAA